MKIAMREQRSLIISSSFETTCLQAELRNVFADSEVILNPGGGGFAGEYSAARFCIS